jgi:Glycosyl transferase family 2
MRPDSSPAPTAGPTPHQGVKEHGAASATLPVCVIIPAYNRATRLRGCLQSIRAQRPALPAEVIVVDDHSSDDTAFVAASLGARVIQHEENRGPGAARNTGVEATSCEWVAFLDSDDEWLPNHLAHLWKLRGNHVLVGSSVLLCFGNPGRDRFKGPVGRRPVDLRSPDTLISTFNLFAVSACMIKRDVLVAMGGFHEWWEAEDLDLWVRVLEQHSARCSPRVTALCHVHDEQLSSNYRRMHDGHRQVATAHLRRTGGSSTPLERWEAVAAWDAMRASLAPGQRRTALRQIPRILCTPQRIVGLAILLWKRLLLRRRSAEIGRDGDASVALLVRNASTRRAVMQLLCDRSIRDVSNLSTPRALAALVRRPAGVVVTGSCRHAVVLRALGARAITADQALDGTNELGPVYATGS